MRVASKANSKQQSAQPRGIDADAAIKALKKRDAQIFRVAHDYIKQQRLTEKAGGVAIVCSTIYMACFDTIRRDSKEEAKGQLARAGVIEAALKVLGVSDVPHSGHVHPNRMALQELESIDPHFRSLVRRLGGDLDAISPITALKQMVIDLHEWAAHLKALRKDRAFFFYLGRNFTRGGFRPPVKVQALNIYRVLCEAVKEAGGKPLPEYPFNDYKKARKAIDDGSKAARA